MTAAALISLYGCSQTSQSTRKMRLNDLHRSDIKKLVSILRDYPDQGPMAPEYWQRTELAIDSLPPHFRAPNPPKNDQSGEDRRRGKAKELCPHHQNLNVDVITSIWSTLQHEIESAIGPFLYPLIITAELPFQQEFKVRQLEPVLEMWVPNYDSTAQVPEGRVELPSAASGRWIYQGNQCPACMLSRLNSDQLALSALLAGTVGRLRSRDVGQKDRVKSSRIQWVKCALKEFDNGDEIIDDAWDLGLELKRLRQVWKEQARREGKKCFYGWQNMRHSICHTERPASATVDILMCPKSDDYGEMGNTPTTPSPPPMHRSSSVYSMQSSRSCSSLPRVSQGSWNRLPVHPPSDHYYSQPVRLPVFRRTNSGFPAKIGTPELAHRSVHSHRGTVEDVGEFEWEDDVSASEYSTSASEQLTHNYRTHMYTANMPAPLNPYDKMVDGKEQDAPEMLKPNRCSMYAGNKDLMELRNECESVARETACETPYPRKSQVEKAPVVENSIGETMKKVRWTRDTTWGDFC